jgi:hypothetical protein
MAFFASVLVVAGLGLMPDDRLTGPIDQTIVIVPDGGTVLHGGLKAKPTTVVPDGGTVLLGGLKRLSEPAVAIPDGGTVLLGGLKRLR